MKNKKKKKTASPKKLPAKAKKISTPKEKKSVIKAVVEEAVNEELKSAKEELQAINKEIATLINELQRRNTQLTQLNDDHNNLMECVNLPIVMVGRDLRVRRCSPAAEKVLRLIPDDIGRRISDLKSDIDLHDLESIMFQVMNTGTLKELELRSAQGQWYKIQIRPYRTSNLSIDGAVVIFFDVTKLKAYGDYREAIFQSINQPFLILDADLKVTFANKSFFETFQTKPEETIGQFMYQLGNGQWNLPKFRELLKEVLLQRTTISNFLVGHDFPLIGPRTMTLNARFIQGDEEEENTVLIAVEDITKRKKAEYEASLRAAIVNFSEDAILSRDLDGAILTWNKSAEHLFGYTSQEILGKKLIVNTPEAQERENAKLELLKLNGRIDSYESIGIHKDGHTFDVSITASLINDVDGRIVGISKIIRDITEHKLIEVERVIAQTAEEERRRIGLDLHDGLCQQLTGTALIAKALAHKLTDMELAEAARASEISELINRSIEQTRDLARGLTPVEVEACGLAPALQKLVESTQNVYNIRCVFNLDESSGAQCQCTSIQANHLYWIAREAFNNALNHSKAKQVTISLSVLHERGLLTIQDDGIGFEIHNNKQMGLGLRNMRYRSKFIGAQLDIHRGPGGGTIVACSYPCLRQSNN